MYMVFFMNRPAGNIKHAHYEAARQRARKIIRRLPTWPAFVNMANPAINKFGYSIRKVG